MSARLDDLAYAEKAAAEVAFKALQEEWIRKRTELFAHCNESDQYGQLTEEASEMRAAVWRMCQHDPLFFFDWFAWCDEPGELGDAQEIPLILFEAQRQLVTDFVAAIMSTVGTTKKMILLIEKSREMGASWILVILAIWFLIFHKSKVLMASRKEEETDKKGDLDTPFEKIRFVCRRLPDWILPAGFNVDKDMGERLIRNPKGGHIVGEASCEHFGRGGRSLWGMMDEFPTWEHDIAAMKATGQTCKVRVLVGTPNGPHNLHAKLAQGKTKEKVLKFRLHWKDHPVKGAGLRKLPDGTLSSPWYEDQREVMNDEERAAELDIRYDISTKALVFSDFTEDHIKSNLSPQEKSKIICIWDPGLTFYVLFMQIDHYNRVLCLQELCLERARIHDVAQEVITVLNRDYRDYDVVHCGDPAGSSRQSSGQADPEYVTLYEYDIDVEYEFMQEMAAKNRVKSRIVAIHNKLREYVPNMKTLALLVDREKCPILVEALQEGYRWKLDSRSKEPLPIIDERHPYEDAVDCLGMGILFRLGVVQSDSGNVVNIEKGSVKWHGGTRRRRV